MPTPFDEEDKTLIPPPLQSLPPMPPEYGTGFKPTGGLPPPTPIAPPPIPPPVAPAPVAATHTPQKYGLDQQMAVEQDILKRRGGIAQTAGNAMTGLADSIMQGVARAGSGNFQQNLQNRNTQTETAMRGMMEKGAAGESAQRKAAMEEAKNDPASAISQTAQRASMPTLLAMGLTRDEIALMPASLIGEATTQRLSLEEIRTKAEETRALREQTGLYQQGMLENTRKGQAQTSEQNKADQKLDAKKSRMAAAEAVLKRSGNARAFGIPIPFTSDVSGKDQKAAQKVLLEGMDPNNGEETKPVNSQEEYDALPSGTRYIDSKGKTATKK